MRRWKETVLAGALVLGLCACGSGRKGGYEVGGTYHGFTLVNKQFVRELDADCLFFEHRKSGASLLKVLSRDDNKTFSVTFRTPPTDDTGVPHIIEHAVLNGSESFPVKSPFDVLSQGSLKTFLNAMTGSDYTIYPVASRNARDFMNLMHVYLDAVFRPLLHRDDHVLEQEGWHLHLENPQDPLTIRGVVYNEMKGAFSSPQRQMDLLIGRALFPDTCYAHSAGGYPPAIPTLTQEAFRSFHRRYYHPSNCLIFIYGDGDPEEELAFVDESYLSHFDRAEVMADIPLQKALPEPVEVLGEYGVPEGSGTEGRTFLVWAGVYGRNSCQEDVIALDILAHALVNGEGAPLRLALQKAGIGKDVSAFVDNIQQNVLQITVDDAGENDLPRFREVLEETVSRVIEGGFDRQIVDGIINRMEFKLREGRGGSMTGVVAAMGAVPGWMFAGDPVRTLTFEEPLGAIRGRLDQRYLEELTRRVFVGNTHVGTLALRPRPGLEKELEERTEGELARRKAAMSAEEVAGLVRRTRELMARQQRQDSPEALKTIPLLELRDISRQEEVWPLERQDLNGAELLYHEDFTRGIVYLDLYFDVASLPQELIPYLQLASEMMGLLDTEQMAFADLENQINLNTGGIATRLMTVLPDRDDNRLKAYFVMGGKAMPDRVGRLLNLMEQQLLHTRWEGNPDRLREVLFRLKAQADQQLSQNGLGLARTRLLSYFTNEGCFDDLTGGLAYHRFLSDLTEHYEENRGYLVGNLRRVVGTVFKRTGLHVGLTTQKDLLEETRAALLPLIAGLAETDLRPAHWVFPRENRNEGFRDASKVQYVAMGYDMTRLGGGYNGRMQVLQQVLSRVYLRNTIRVQGGAYGASASLYSHGPMIFSSFRDPHLARTVEQYLGAGAFLKNYRPDERDLRRLIIGTISNRDVPLTARQRGRVAVSRFFAGLGDEQIQREREEILNTTAEDLRACADLVARVMAQKVLCVVGNEKVVDENRSLFKTVENLRP